MAATVSQAKPADSSVSPWNGFRTGLWQKEINVRDFIQQNYEPYDGDGSFLEAGHRTDRTHLGHPQAALRRGAQEGRARRLADTELDHRARAWLYRQRQRDHRRPADRSAAQARDHAERRPAPGHQRAEGVRLRAGPAGRRSIHASTARHTTMRCSMPTRLTCGGAAARTS